MIKIKIDKASNKVIKIKINGHAHYAKAGKDIVCAAVSSIVITTINNILSINKTIEYIEDNSGLTINVITDDDNTQKMLNNMLSMLEALEKDYAKYIKIF